MKQPFDYVLSRRLDTIQALLDAQPRGVAYLRLKLLKRWLERNVPAWTANGGAL